MKLEVAYHQQQEDDWSSAKPLVFVMDAPPEGKRKTKVEKGQTGSKGPSVTSKNFGAWMDISKFKTCGDTLNLAWRCRVPSYLHLLIELPLQKPLVEIGGKWELPRSIGSPFLGRLKGN